MYVYTYIIYNIHIIHTHILCVCVCTDILSRKGGVTATITISRFFMCYVCLVIDYILPLNFFF